MTKEKYARMTKYAAESGRSMFEILAVMAIACVLTVGGVEGYQMAMQKHRTNTLLEGATQRAIIASQQLALDKDPEDITLGGFPTDGGNGITYPTKPKRVNDEFFALPVAGLDEPTCKQLQTMTGGILRRVDCKEENGSVTAELIYHKDLSTTADASDLSPGGSGGGTPASHTYDNDPEGCEKAGYQYCTDNTCITKEETCPAEEEPAPNCDQYPGAVMEDGEQEERSYAGPASDGLHWCYCPANYTLDAERGCITEEEDMDCSFSPCTNCTIVHDEKIYTFLPKDTDCEQAGLKGKCTAYGQCIPTEGQSCNSIDGCPDGYFCNYGGVNGPGKCEKVNFKTTTINDVTYYYNTLQDLKSWCRPADGGFNCTWGFLAYHGAESWCHALGKTLISATDVTEELVSAVPVTRGEHDHHNNTYWLDDTNWLVIEVSGEYWFQSNNVNRLDGYAGNGGVICK